MSQHWSYQPSEGVRTDPARALTLAYRLSAILAILLFIAAVVGVFVPEVYRDTALWAAQARGVNLVDLVVALPTLVIALFLTGRGSWRARIVWVGVLGYVLYDEAIFAFDIRFNSLFLIYVALLSLATFSLITSLTHLDVAALRLRVSSRVPARGVAIYLLIVAALFFLTWMKDIVPAVLGGTVPSTIREAGVPSNPVYVLDLGFLIPLYVLSAIWILARRGWGYVLAGALLVLNALLGLSIASSALFQHAVDGSVSLVVVPMFGVIALVSIGLGVLYLRGLPGTA